MAVNDIWQLNVLQRMWGQDLTNTHYFQQGSPDPPMGAAASIIGAYQDDVQAAQLACQSPDLSIVGYSARRIFPNPSQPWVTVQNTPGTNGIALAGGPANATAYLQYKGTPIVHPPDLRADQRMGATHLSGATQLDQRAGLWAPLFITVLKAFVTALLAQLNEPNENVDWKKVIWDTILEVAVQIVTSRVSTSVRTLRTRTERP